MWVRDVDFKRYGRCLVAFLGVVSEKYGRFVGRDWTEKRIKVGGFLFLSLSCVQIERIRVLFPGGVAR